ncbi:MAG: efflux RND transporter periplasmic adaptor subunit, partial [archaeon]
KWWSALIAIVILVVAYSVFFGGPEEKTPDFVAVEKRNVVEEVSSTGTVKPLSDLDLSFERSGKVSSVAVSVGDKVKQGDRLVSLTSNDLAADLEQAKAGLRVAEANLASLKKGSTPEEITVSESKVQGASNDLSDSKKSLINTIEDAYTKSDDAIRNKIDLMFDNPQTSNASLKFQTDYQLNNDIVNARLAMQSILTSWNASTTEMIANSNIDGAISLANKNLNSVKGLLDKIALAVNTLLASSAITQTTIDAWKLSVSTARTTIALSISGLSTSLSTYRSYESALKIAQDQLAVTKSGATAEDLQAKEAAVEEARASVNSAEVQLSKSFLASPINGVISRVDAKVGQVIQSGINVVSVISLGEYDVESLIPEADIAKIKVGQSATTTLDAYGSDTYFQTTVIKIDPAETVVEGVPTYKVTLKFVRADDRVKSGMTANLDILTNMKIGVLSVPSRTVYSSDSKKFVKLIDPEDDKKTIETEVGTGVRGVDGYIEIISGLKEGDKVVSTPNIL